MKTVQLISSLAICLLISAGCEKDVPFAKKLINASRVVESKTIVEDIATGQVISSTVNYTTTIDEQFSWRDGYPSRYISIQNGVQKMDSEFFYEDGRLVKQIDHTSNGEREIDFTYTDGRLSKDIDSNSDIEEFYYDENGHIISVIAKNHGGPDDAYVMECAYEYSGENVVKYTKKIKQKGAVKYTSTNTYEYGSKVLNPYKDIFRENCLESPETFRSANINTRYVTWKDGNIYTDMKTEIVATDGDYPTETLIKISSSSEADGQRVTNLTTATTTYTYQKI